MLYLTYLIAILAGPSAATGLFVGRAIAGAHRPERLGSRGIPVAHLVRPATLPASTSCDAIPYMPIDRGEIIDPDAPIGYEIVETAVAQVLVPAVAQ